VLVGDGIEPADHCGGRIGLASSTVASGDRLPQHMSGWRQLKVWVCVSDVGRQRGQRFGHSLSYSKTDKNRRFAAYLRPR